MTPLVHYAEPYSPNGNMSAKGATRLLGRPDLDWLEILLREALQNIWDARIDRQVPECQIHLRKLAKSQLAALKNQVFTNLSKMATEDPLMNALASRDLPVLEICDYGTAGLGGPSRADAETSADEGRNFIDFARNFGSARDVVHGGGTYGYGKSALHEASKCKTIVVYSRAICSGRMTSRIIALRLGDPYETRRGGFKRYTGRHLWGVMKDGVLEPMEGTPADELAETLGLRRRKSNESGTSIVVLDPQFEEQDTRKCLERIVTILLWNFWPKMVKQSATGTPAMRIVLLHESTAVPIGDPAKHPQLGLFCNAMLLLKADLGTIIQSERPRKILGKLASVSGILTKTPDTLYEHYPVRSHHVALMRPAELIVKYLPCAQPSDPNTSYGAVFICDAGDEVEEAFADSEPPAHDNWEPHRMDKGRAKTFVSVALRRIQSEMDSKYITVVTVDNSNAGDGTSLAEVAERTAQLMGILPGDGASKNPPGTGGYRESVPRPVVRFERLEILDSHKCSLFSVVFPQAGHFSFKPGLYGFDGSADTAPDGSRPEVIRVIVNGKQLNPAKPLPARDNQKASVYVTVPENTAVKLGVQEVHNV